MLTEPIAAILGVEDRMRFLNKMSAMLLADCLAVATASTWAGTETAAPAIRTNGMDPA
jgi:hypothetical protein